MFFPYRTKNPPEAFPYLTIALIVVNIVVYCLTTDSLLVVTDEAVAAYGLSHSTFFSHRLITALFIHESPLHLLGNMWFLWLFGAAVEGRLGPLRYLVLYFAAGIAGDMLHDAVLGSMNPDQASIGASGAVMALGGAYVYLFPFATIVVAYWVRFSAGVTEWQARWVVLIYLGFDVLGAVAFQGQDGVGHLAHIGGIIAGFLICLLFRAQRDSEARANAQAMRADMGGYDGLSYAELSALMENPTDDPALVLAYVRACLRYPGDRSRNAAAVVARHLPILLQHEDARSVGAVVAAMPTDMALPGIALLRLGSRLQSAGCVDLACGLYNRIVATQPGTPDAASAQLRLARVQHNVYRNATNAEVLLRDLISRYPDSETAMEAQEALLQIGRSRTI